MDLSFSDLNCNSEETLSGGDNLKQIDRMGDNHMPFDLLVLVDKDEALAGCQYFNAEVLYGFGR